MPQSVGPETQRNHYQAHTTKEVSWLDWIISFITDIFTCLFGSTASKSAAVAERYLRENRDAANEMKPEFKGRVALSKVEVPDEEPPAKIAERDPELEKRYLKVFKEIPEGESLESQVKKHQDNIRNATFPVVYLKAHFTEAAANYILRISNQKTSGDLRTRICDTLEHMPFKTMSNIEVLFNQYPTKQQVEKQNAEEQAIRRAGYEKVFKDVPEQIQCEQAVKGPILEQVDRTSEKELKGYIKAIFTPYAAQYVIDQASHKRYLDPAKSLQSCFAEAIDELPIFDAQWLENRFYQYTFQVSEYK